MALIPTDVEEKTFGAAFRGYNVDEVDDFLDEVAATLRGQELAIARSGDSSALFAPGGDESAVGRALIVAHTAADTIIAEAREESEKLRADAQEEADSWKVVSDAKRVEAQAEMAELSQHVVSVRYQLAVLATAVADRLDEMDETLPDDLADDESDSEDALDDNVYDDLESSEGESE
jgi:cell division initiation protein